MAKDRVYFLGIGGIGMSALARYFLHEGWQVAGYDRTATDLTRKLEAEGAQVHYEDDVKLIQEKDYIKNPKANGYRSLHLIVEVPIYLHDQKKMMKVEVQIRTLSMDFWASLEHKIKYKKNIDENIVEEVNKELLDCANICNQLDKRIELIKTKAES